MSGFSIQLKGLSEVLDKLDTAKLKNDISDEFTAFGLDVVRDAKQGVPVDEGLLKNAIGSISEQIGDTVGVTIFVNADYAAFVEFGTRKFAAAYVATLPQDWKTFAAQYKGKTSGTFQELVARIVKWVSRKGISGTYSVKTQKRTGNKLDKYAEDYKVAYVIARSILINGIKPHPFLFPAFEKNRVQLIKNLENLLK